MIKGLLIAAGVFAQAPVQPAPPAPRAPERASMVREVANLAQTAGVGDAQQISPAVLAAMRRVPRHLFMPEEVRHLAYRNEAMPIGGGQTISQPYIVALMSHLLQVRPGQRVLEIGTGSGYQAAILADMGVDVRSIEIVEPLAREAAERLRTLGYRNVIVRAGDGYGGWPDAAPFDRIIVTAGAPHIPQPLIDQLKPGGRMVIPVTRRPGEEELLLVTKGRSGTIRRRVIIPVRFVPLTRNPG